VRGAYPTLFRAAAALSDNHADCEDLVQQTLLQACRAYGSFRGESSATTWMYRILLNLARTPLERRQMLPLDDAAYRLPAAGAGPDAVAQLSEEQQTLLAALRGLPRQQREIAVLFYLEQLSYEEISQSLGVSLPAIKSSLSRARAGLRAVLRPPSPAGNGAA
jgi:RNA polymerase sigma factor (sigma-70 family)